MCYSTCSYSTYIPLSFPSLFESRFLLSISISHYVPLFPYPMPAFKSVSPFLFIGMNFLFHLLCSSVPSPLSAGQGKAGKHRTALHLSRTSHATIHALPCTCEFLTCASRHTRPSLLLLPETPARRTLTQYLGSGGGEHLH